eukprot:GILJ01004028.1.p1 GENE.GILJ01004028.1~~GILJ01004028.1.p1  ORF type:complete len:414 (-),score=67.94 GILJ01004028.1:310-1515(-)
MDQGDVREQDVVVVEPSSTTTSSSSASAVLLDFSSMFGKPLKTRKSTKKKTRAKSEDCVPLEAAVESYPVAEDDEDEEEEQETEDMFEIMPTVCDDSAMIDYSVAVPRNLTVTREDMARRKHLDLVRWYCISRPQYKKSCGISSLTSCWNYLYSTLGHGHLQPISQEEVMAMLGFKPPFQDIRFGPFTGNQTLVRWFGLINKRFGVTGSAGVFWKLHGPNRTVGVSADDALDKLKQGLRDTKTAFIYHCFNHYLCPIGYDEMPISQVDAYQAEVSKHDTETWIAIGEPSRAHPPIHFKRWTDIAKDIDCQNPSYFNIRHTERGVMQRQSAVFTTGKKLGGNLHCLLYFSSAGDDAMNGSHDDSSLAEPRDDEKERSDDMISTGENASVMQVDIQSQPQSAE